MAMIPLWLKISYAIVVAVITIVYVRKYGLPHFLWFSDIAMLVAVAALWLESAFLASMMALAVLLPEILWNVSFFGRLLFGIRITGLTDYMFDPEKPLYLRGLSLFHIFLPVLLVWMTARLGYEPEAWIAQTIVAWVVLPLTYWLTDPRKENVNWVRGIEGLPPIRMSPMAYLGVLMIAFPLLLYLPTHVILNMLFGILRA
jgi:hypothetical protein